MSYKLKCIVRERNIDITKAVKRSHLWYIGCHANLSHVDACRSLQITQWAFLRFGIV